MILLNNETIIKFLNKSNTFTDYEVQYSKVKSNVTIFINKLKEKSKKREKVLINFKNIIKYKKLVKNKPCNEYDLYTTEEYNNLNKNIYLIDMKLNKKWWFSIETITKLLCNNLSYFDGETYDILCKSPINPYTNEILNTGQLTSIYEQLKKYKVNKLLVLFRLVNFNIDKLLELYNDDIINYSYKYNLESVDNEGLLLILENVMYLNNIKYVNINKLDITNENIKLDIIQLLKDCLLTYKKKSNILTKIKLFILLNKNIIKRANRDPNKQIKMDLSENDSDDESVSSVFNIDNVELEYIEIIDLEINNLNLE